MAGAFFAVLAFFAGAFFAGAFFAGAFFAAAFFVPVVEDAALAELEPERGLTAGSEALPFSTSLKVVLGPKRTPRDAAMRTGAPVWGFRPMRAARRVGLKLPKPTIETFRPALTSAITALMKALTAASASRLASDVVLLMESISSDLFTATSFSVAECR